MWPSLGSPLSHHTIQSHWDPTGGGPILFGVGCSSSFQRGGHYSRADAHVGPVPRNETSRCHATEGRENFRCPQHFSNAGCSSIFTSLVGMSWWLALVSIGISPFHIFIGHLHILCCDASFKYLARLSVRLPASRCFLGILYTSHSGCLYDPSIANIKSFLWPALSHFTVSSDEQKGILRQLSFQAFPYGWCLWCPV